MVNTTVNPAMNARIPRRRRLRWRRSSSGPGPGSVVVVVVTLPVGAATTSAGWGDDTGPKAPSSAAVSPETIDR